MKISFSKHTDSEVKDGIKIPYPAGKRVFPRAKWYLVMVIVFSPFIYMLFQIGYPLLFATSPGLLTMERFNITAPQAGTVTAVLAKVGDKVEKGREIFTFESAESLERRERLAILTAELDAVLKEAGYSSVDAGYLAEARENARKQADILKKTMTLFYQGAATKAELNAAEEGNKGAQAALSKILGAADIDKRQFMQARNRDIARLNAEINALQNALHTQAIESPVSGNILSITATPEITVGQGSVLASVGAPEKIQIIAFVDVPDFRLVTPGREAKVVFPDKSFITARVMPLPSYDEIEVERTVFAENKQVIRIKLEPLGSIDNKNRIDGVPVKVDWGLSFELPWR